MSRRVIRTRPAIRFIVRRQMASDLPFNSNGIIGNSPVMKTLDCQISTAARSDLTVLITGESGTGKELVARAIHNSSERAAAPFVSFSCGAIIETLLESELFGYEKGTFTGATQSRQGLFEAANGGTIFLDEIGEMATACQVKLLRVLQESAVRPIGAHLEIPVDVRVIAATNRHIPQEIALGRFRQDLFYRIAVLTIGTPALRERPSDIPLLVEHFLAEAAKNMKRSVPGIETDAVTALSLYTWPGNVRQLQNVVQRLVASLNNGHKIRTSEVHEALEASSLLSLGPQVPMIFRETDSLDDFMDRTLLGLYDHFKGLTGSHIEAARLMGTHRSALYKRINSARKRLSRNGDSSDEDREYRN
jgi:transcriptional regulator with PAS, ATPase and Fis domain